MRSRRTSRWKNTPACPAMRRACPWLRAATAGCGGGGRERAPYLPLKGGGRQAKRVGGGGGTVPLPPPRRGGGQRGRVGGGGSSSDCADPHPTLPLLGGGSER